MTVEVTTLTIFTGALPQGPGCLSAALSLRNRRQNSKFNSTDECKVIAWATNKQIYPHVDLTNVETIYLLMKSIFRIATG